MADHNPEDGRACTECGGPLSEARNALGLESCSGPCNAARRRRLACEMVRTIPEVLAQHQRITSKPGGPCWCGQWPRDDVRRDTWMDHVANELAPLIDALAQARACPADMSGIHAPDGAGACLNCDAPCPEQHGLPPASTLENGQACDRGPCWLGKGHNGDCRPGPGRMTTPPALTPDENAATEPPLALQRDVHGATQQNPGQGVIHLRAVLDQSIPVCRGEVGPNDRLGEEREGDCPECLAIRSGRGLKVYVGRRRVR